MSASKAPAPAVSNPEGERDFATVCASLCADDEGGAHADFPLRSRVRLQSRIAPAFQSNEFHLDVPARRDAGTGLPVMQIGFLTLAGPGGALPWWITEKIMRDAHGDGKALHRFLDLLNRRFWELLFLKSSLGNNPQQGFSSPHHAMLFIELSFAMAGLEHAPGWPRTPDMVTLLHRIKQHCWSTACGSGSPDSLASLLSAAHGGKVEVLALRLVCVPVADQARLVLGRSASGRLSRTAGVIGARALVSGGVLLRLVLQESKLLDAYLPSGGGARLKLLYRVLHIFYAQHLPQVAMRLQCRADDTFSRLGGQHCRLGWGASLSVPRPYSQIIDLSVRALNVETS